MIDENVVYTDANSVHLICAHMSFGLKKACNLHVLCIVMSLYIIQLTLLSCIANAKSSLVYYCLDMVKTHTQVTVLAKIDFFYAKHISFYLYFLAH